MAGVKRQRVPVTVLTGFLGAGKTTLLNRIVREPHGRRMAVLVNDFGAINIDAQLIASVESDRIALTNGCICCSVRNDLLSALLQLITERPEIEHVVIEASGISHPVGIADTLFQPVLADLLSIDGILAVVDTAAYADLDFADGELALEQMTVADLVILNKMDLATPAHARQVREDLSYAAPQARIIETTHAQVPLDVLFDRGGADHDRLTSHAHSQHLTAHGYQSWSWSADRPLDAERFRAFVRALPTAVYRAKGIVHLADTPGQAWVFQLVGPRAALEPTESSPGVPQSRLVCIGRRGSVDYDTLQQQLDRCCTTNDDIASQLQYSRVSGGTEPSRPWRHVM